MRTGLLVGIFSPILSLFSQNIFSTSINTRQIVIFGDSYSDSGNTFNKSSNTYPGRAYFLGHFTNGLTWVEYLAIKLKIDIMDQNIFRNYAYGLDLDFLLSDEVHSCLINKELVQKL